MKEFLTRPEAAKYLKGKGLKVAARTLAKYVVTGGGPAYRSFGRPVYYTAKDLDDWVASKMKTNPMKETAT